MFSVWDDSNDVGFDFPELFSGNISELGGVNVTGSWNDDVVSNIVLIVISFNCISCDWKHVLSDTSRWLAEEMILKIKKCVLYNWYSGRST